MAKDFTQLNAKAHRFLLKQAKTHKKGAKLCQLLRASGAAEMPTKPRGSLVSVLARAIVGQQVAAKVAATFWQRLQDQAELNGGLLELLAPRHQKKIRAIGVSNNKTRFLVGLGEAHRAGQVSARRVSSLPHEERVAYLTQLDGIGVWTADMVGIFYCLDTNIWPQGDLAVRRTLATLTQTDENKTESIAEHFQPLRTFLALHMWSEKNNPMVSA